MRTESSNLVFSISGGELSVCVKRGASMVGDGLSVSIVCMKYLCLDVRLKRNSDNLLNYTEVTVNNLLEVLQNVTFDRNKCFLPNVTFNRNKYLLQKVTFGPKKSFFAQRDICRNK